MGGGVAFCSMAPSYPGGASRGGCVLPVVTVVRVLLVMSMVTLLQVISRVMVTLVGVLQVVCWLVVPLVLPVGRVLQVMLWVVVSLVVPMVRVPQAMHRVMAPPFLSILRVLYRVMVRLVCAAGGAMAGGGAVARVLQTMQRLVAEL